MAKVTLVNGRSYVVGGLCFLQGEPQHVMDDALARILAQRTTEDARGNTVRRFRVEGLDDPLPAVTARVAPPLPIDPNADLIVAPLATAPGSGDWDSAPASNAGDMTLDDLRQGQSGV